MSNCKANVCIFPAPPILSKSDVQKAQQAAVTATNAANSAEQSAIEAGQYADAILQASFAPSQNHNFIYRGKNLGTITSANIASFLSEHEVSTGKFTDLYVGDEITIQDGEYNAVWLIAGFDTEYNKGDTAFTTHHITLIPKTPLYNDQMNSSNVTTGGYKGSAMHTTKLPALATKLKTALGTHLLTHRAILGNAVNTEAAAAGASTWKGMTSGWEWTDVECVLPTEVQVYGATIWSSSGWDTGEAEQKLPVFNFINPVQFSRWGFWLRGVASGPGFCFCYGHGHASTNNASASFGVRPLICVG